MANHLYPKGAEKILSASINLGSDTIKVALVSDAYTYSASHEFFSSVSSASLGTPQTLTGVSVTEGVVDATDVTFAAVASGSTAKFVVLYKDTGTPSTSPLLYIADTVTGLPMATHSGDITIQWDGGAYKIFSIVP